MSQDKNREGESDFVTTLYKYGDVEKGQYGQVPKGYYILETINIDKPTERTYCSYPSNFFTVSIDNECPFADSEYYLKEPEIKPEP